MNRRSALQTDAQGATAIEFAIALPVLVVLLWGIVQIGMAGWAIAGMQHGLAEGGRLGTLCIKNTTTNSCDAPTDDAIKQRVLQKVFGVSAGTFNTPTITTPPPSDCANCRDLSVTFSMPMNFLLFQGPTINLTQSKRIYLAT